MKVLSLFEELVLYVTIPLVALFAHKEYTYEFSTPKYAILTISTLLIGVYLLFKLLQTKKFKFYATKVHFVWLAFSIVALLSTINTWRDNPYFFRQAFDIGLYLFLNVLWAFYFSTILDDKKKIARFLFVFVLTGLFVAINAILNFYLGYDIMLGQVGSPFERASIKANIGNVIFVSNYLNMLLPIALYFVVSLDLGVINVQRFSAIFFLKFLSLISAILYLDVIIFSQTRSEYLALVVEVILLVVAYFFFIRKREDKAEMELQKSAPKVLARLKSLRRISVLVFILMALLLVVLYNIPSPFNNYGTFTMTERFNAMASVSSRDERFLSWFSTLYMWKKHKLLGQGIGTYQLYGLYGIADLTDAKPIYSYGWNNFKRAHNDYFQILGETGVIGLSLIVLMLVLLTLYIARNIRKIQDRDDIILFSMLVLSGIVFAFQSVFSFPGHLLPNALLATFVISAGLGKYFNKVDGREYEVKGTRALTVGFVLIFAVAGSTYLRWNHFVSEVYFRNGNIAFQTLVTLRDQMTQIDNYLKQLDQIESDLNNFSGQFQIYSPENWHKYKQSQSGTLSGLYNRAQAESERLQNIQNIKNQIEQNRRTLIAQKEAIPQEVKKYYEEAKSYFLKSIQLNHTYGKSYFYLAALASDPIRIEMLKEALRKDPEAVLSQNYDEYQKILPERFKYAYYKDLAKYIKENPSFLDKIDMPTVQALVDSSCLYEFSLLTFTERNTFKTLAIRYNSLYLFTKMVTDTIEDEELKKKTVALESVLFNKFDTWVRRTLYIMPGGWNRFPDWKNIDIELATTGGQDIYRYFASLTVQALDPVNVDSRNLLVDMAKLEAKTCKYMEEKGVWGVPDGVLDYLHALAREYQIISEYQESIVTYSQLLEWYKENYDYISKKVDNKEFWDKSYEKFVEDLKNQLDSLLAKDDKGYLSNSLTPMFEDRLRRLYQTIMSTDFKQIEKEYVDEIVKYAPSLWPRVGKSSVWKTNAYNSMKDFENQLGALNFSEEARKELNSILTGVINTDLMKLYERYARFKAHYELIKDEFLNTAQVLISLYQEKPEEEIMKDWKEPMFSMPEFKSKEEVLKFLNELIEKYK
ncbi:O-antigen ligase family protein [Fervidobacterium islandicum]|uniref:O-antigen ligase family protein n=1 Tax=Fervidobacterium islandicum TaxID=2423 RepID=A0AAI8CKQ1_FERIS|nr:MULTISPECIES: O-antigen ligase [Fervidobacterium]AMW32123.2 O-antigen ligase family protein [Fervidobacterium islandicum]